MSVLNLNKCWREALRSSVQTQRRLQQQQARVRASSRKTEAAVVPVFRRAGAFLGRPALQDCNGSYTYGNLFAAAKEVSHTINVQVGYKPGQRIMFLCPNDASYVITQWGIWMSGHIAVPLSIKHPHSLLLYYCNDTNSKLLITTPKYAELTHRVVKNTDTKLFVLDEKLQQNATEQTPKNDDDLRAGLSAEFYNRADAMILYTSGTTGNPKGVVLTHKNLITQATILADAWRWSQTDAILHTLPLHHVHGIVNALLCPLNIGSKVIMLPKFDSTTVWSHLLGINMPSEKKVSVFMAVPTIYAKLIEEYDKLFGGDAKMQGYIRAALKSRVRLMVSGSAPLPQPVFDRWFDISGHKLLERYGMTEIGMCLSQEYESERTPGYVGVPLPSVSIRIGEKSDGGATYDWSVDATNSGGVVKVKTTHCPKGDFQGELLVKGDSVFKEYYNKPDATKAEFTPDKYFKTGDICRYDPEKRLFKILGRNSVDIIKTGGYKVSAVEIETELLAHAQIKECAVVGLKDAQWGERVAAVVVVRGLEGVDVEGLRGWAQQRMAGYAVPRVWKVVGELPKNAMGKVNKKELVKSHFAEEEKGK